MPANKLARKIKREKEKTRIPVSTEKSRLNALTRRMKESGLLKGHSIVPHEQSEEKLSGMLSIIAKPLLEHAKNFTERKMAIAAAVVAWNMSLLPAEKQELMMRDFVNNQNFHDPADDTAFIEVLSFLLERKQELFPDVKRSVVDYTLTETKDTYQLSVASTMG